MTILRNLVLVGAGLALLMGALLTTGPRAVPDWRGLRAVALESDDWGLAGFVPQPGAWDGLDRAALAPGRFPAVYWESTLEDADLIGRLGEVLARHRGRDGLAAVFQPNYVMASLAWDQPTGQWVGYALPHWPPQYRRPGLWEAVQAVRARGLWHPELHAHLHYDPERRRSTALSTEVARTATLRGISLFPGSEQARELAPWRPEAALAAELDQSLATFRQAFGRDPGSIIAPDYTWHGANERMWAGRGLQVIQAKREQRNPRWWPGRAGRVQKYLDRQWSRLVHPGRIYLERNCRLEPVQAPDPQAIVAACVADTRRAWRRGEPAIVETHRVNFAHTDPAVTAVGLAALDAYLAQVSAATPGPVFLCDSEIAGLMRRGTSWRVAGDRVILRNGTHATRIVAVPSSAGAADPASHGPATLYRLAPGEIRVVDLPAHR